MLVWIFNVEINCFFIHLLSVMESKSKIPQTGAIRKSFIPSKRPSLVKTSKFTKIVSTVPKIHSEVAMNMSNNNEVIDDELQSWHNWVGRRVTVCCTKVGTLRFFGKTHFAEGSWCGVELDEPVGKNNGIVKDVRYFTCKDNFGIFAPLSKTEKILDVDSKDIIPKSKLLPPTYKKHRFSKSDALKQSVEVGKSHLPYGNTNINERKANTIYERPHRMHYKTDASLDRAETDFNSNQFSNYNENNDALKLSHLKLYERRASSPLNFANKESVEQIFNRTITKDNGKLSSYAGQRVSLGGFSDNSFLRTAFDVLKSQDKNTVNKKDRTFVIDKPDILHNDFTKTRLVRSNTEEDNTQTSTELEESSLGILSYKQMEELSFGNNTITAIKNAPEIRKVESCDDVNEISEYEEYKISEENVCEVSQNSVFELNETFEHKSNSKSLETDELNETVILDGKFNMIDQLSFNAANECSNELFNNLPSNHIKSSEFESELNFPIEDINLNIVPGASSTPTYSTLESGKFSEMQKNSSLTVANVPSITFNRTFKLLSKETDSSIPELNVISKLLHDLDATVENTSTAEKKVLCDNLSSQPIASKNCIQNNVNHEMNNSNANKNESNIALNLSFEKKKPILQTALSSFSFNKSEMNKRCDVFNSNIVDQLEKKSGPVTMRHDETCSNETFAINLNTVSSNLYLCESSEVNNTLLNNAENICFDTNIKNGIEFLSKTYTLDQSNSQNSLPSMIKAETDVSSPSEKNECSDFTLATIKELKDQENHSDETILSDATISAADDNEIDASVAFSYDSSACSNLHSEATTDKNTESASSERVVAEKNPSTKVNNITDVKGTSKPPKKNVVSKIKQMLESNKNNSVANRENVNAKSKSQIYKSAGKWSSVTSKISSNFTDNKNKPKSEVTSRINTNLKASRFPFTKTNAQSNKLPEQKKNEVPRGAVVSRNTVNVQKAYKSKSVSLETGDEKDSRILSQLQNVDSVSGRINESKESKLKLKTADTALPLRSKEKELPFKSGIALYLGRNNTLPKVKQYPRSLLQRK